MKALILQGSPHKRGNTAQLSAPFIDELQKRGFTVEEEWIYDKKLAPCIGCGTCQERIGEVGCVHDDDFAPLVERIIGSDLVVLSTPIYAWYAPGPVKTFLDRLMYAPVKVYGSQKAPSLLRGRAIALLVTGGYPPKEIVVPLEITITHLAKRHELNYLGWTGGTDPGKGKLFMNEKKEHRVRSFADEIADAMC